MGYQRVFVVLAAAYWLESMEEALGPLRTGGVRKCHLPVGNMQPYQIIHAHALANNHNKSQNINFPQRDINSHAQLVHVTCNAHAPHAIASNSPQSFSARYRNRKCFVGVLRDDIAGTLVELVRPGWFVIFERLPFSWCARHVFQYSGFIIGNHSEMAQSVIVPQTCCVSSDCDGVGLKAIPFNATHI